MMKILHNKLRMLLVFVIFITASASWGQSIWTNPITGTNPNTSNPYTTGDNKNANITVSGIGRGSGISGTNANNRYNANGWNAGSMNTNKYFTFTITPNSGYKINLTSFVYTGQASGTGPGNFAFRSSVDNYGANIGSPSATGTTISLTGAAYQNITTPITFRIYAWGASNANGTFSINDFTFNGTVVSAGPVLPTVTTTAMAANDIDSEMATLRGNVTNNGGENLTGKGFVYNTTGSNLTVNAGATTIAVPVSGAGTGAFDETIEGLSPNTRYYFRAYATNGAGTAYGTTTQNFYTHAETPAVPVVSNPTVNTLDVALGPDSNPEGTQYQIRINGDGGSYVTLPGGSTWGTAAQWAANPTVSGLEMNTTYTFDVQARNGAGVVTGFSITAQGTTVAPTTPYFTIIDSLLDFGSLCLDESEVGYVEFKGENFVNGEVAIFPSSGFGYSLNENGPFENDNFTISNYNGETVTVYVRFTPNAVQSYNGTINLLGSSQGEPAIYQVPITGQGVNTPASVTTEVALDTAITSAVIAAEITAQGCTDVTAYGFEYSTVSGFIPGTGAGANIVSTDLDATGLFTAELENLAPNTTYYYVAYVVDGSGIVYGSQQSFSTSDMLVPVTITATNIGQTSFTANWEAVEGASGYRLDVSTSPTFSTTTGGPGVLITETFNNIPSANGYDDREWTGVGGITWTATDARTDETINGKAITFRTGTLTSGIISNTQGLSKVSFRAERKYSESARTLTVTALTGSNYTTPVVIGTLSLNGSTSVYSFDETLSTPITGSYRLELRLSGSYRLAVDDLTFGTESTTTTVPSFITGYENLDVANVTSYEVTGLNPYTTYYYRVRAYSTNDTTANSNVTSAATKAGAVTWNGTNWTPAFELDGVTPINLDTTIDAIIAGDYDTAVNGSLSVKVLTINSGVLTVKSGTTLTVQDAVVNNASAANFIIENNANLLQVNNAPNTGAVTVNKNSNPLYNLDYTIYSSPVAGQNVKAFSPSTQDDRFYIYNTALNAYSNLNSASQQPNVNPDGFNPNTSAFVPGKGYLIRMPHGLAAGITHVYNGQFIGTPNNGNVTIALETTGNRYNAVGNPYPSPINISDFLAANQDNLENGTLYFWRKTNNPEASTYATITNLAYAANNAPGGDVGGEAFSQTAPENYVINPGQGFFVQASQTAGPLVFSNSMRRAITNNQFFRPQQTNAQEITMSRLWLNISNDSGAFSQKVIGYTNTTTNGLDYGWDGRSISDGSISLYSTVDNTKLAIQARAAFTAQDVVALSYKAANSGTYTITLADFDGVFAQGQNIYLKDNLTQTMHDLKGGGYSFVTEAGTTDNRFEVHYVNTTLGIDNPDAISNNVVVFKQGSQMHVESQNIAIKEVLVYDINGRLLYSQNATGNNKAVINVAVQQQVLIVKVTTENNTTVSKKIIF